MYEEDMSYDLAEVATKVYNINELLITQMQHEMINYRTYLNFSGICDNKGLLGASKYFRKQSEDELKHFNLIFDFCCDRVNFRPELLEVPAMEFEDSLLLQNMLSEALLLETHTTRKLCSIKKQAIAQDDFLTDSFLDSLINEQREEEKTAIDVCNRALMFGDSPTGIMLLDQELRNM